MSDENDIDQVFNKEKESFVKLSEEFARIQEEDLKEQKNMNSLLKVSNAMDYKAQVMTGMLKGVLQEQRLKEIERKISRIPVDVLEKYVKNTPDY